MRPPGYRVATPDPGPAPSLDDMRPRPALRAAVLAVAFALPGCGGDGGDPVVPSFQDAAASVTPTVEYAIPSGTAARADAGEDPAIFPNPLVLQVGDVIRIVNDDAIGYDIGPFYVGAGETMAATVTSAGERSSFCSLHPSGSITVIVEA